MRSVETTKRSCFPHADLCRSATYLFVQNLLNKRSGMEIHMTDHVIGAVDIGGTKIMAGIADDQGHVLCSESFPTVLGPGGAESSLAKIVQLLEQQRQKEFAECRSLYRIGVVCAGPVDTGKGIVQNPYTLPGWEEFPLSERLSEETGVPVFLENDANGALIGEVALRHLHKERVLMVTVGTGIGAAFMDRGTLYQTGKGYHPEMGHVVISSAKDLCYCGQAGCFEHLCSGTAVNRRAVQMGYVDFDDLFSHGQGGDRRALGMLTQIAEDFCRGLWNLCVIFKPEVLILGGGMMEQYYSFFAERFLIFIKGREDFVGEVSVVKASAQSCAALIGAAQLK